MEQGLAVIDGNNSLALQKVGAGLFKSGMFPNAKNEFGAFAIVQYGAELGIGPMMSLKNINIISGQIAVNGQLMLSLAIRSGVAFRVIEESDTGCKIEFKRGDITYLAEFTKKDADNAGLTGKDNWKKYPKDMYYWRCVAKGVRRVAPDAVMGLYTPDEISEGKYIDVTEVVAEIPDDKETPQDTKEDKNKEMQKDIGGWLCQIYGGIVEAEKQLEILTRWTKDGKEHEGKKDVFSLSTKENAKGQSQTTVTHHKVKKMYEDWQKEQGVDGADTI